MKQKEEYTKRQKVMPTEWMCDADGCDIVAFCTHAGLHDRHPCYDHYQEMLKNERTKSGHEKN